MSYATFKGKAKYSVLNSDALAKIFAKYPDINLEWLLTGEGKVLKNDTHDNASEFIYQRLERLIPLYDDISSFGDVAAYSINKGSILKPIGHIDRGDWFPEATSAMRYHGDNMTEYPNGCILALKETCNADLIVWGENYMVQTDEFRIIKCLQKGISTDYICAYSSNKETYPDGHLKHEPMDIPKATIRKLALVLGCVVHNK